MSDNSDSDNKPMNEQQRRAIGFYLEGAFHVLKLIERGIPIDEVERRMEGIRSKVFPTSVDLN